MAGVLVATVDGWALLAVQLANALSAGLAGGDPVMPGAADAGQMAQQASLPLSFAPFPEDGDVQRALQEAADAFARVGRGGRGAGHPLPGLGRRPPSGAVWPPSPG